MQKTKDDEGGSAALGEKAEIKRKSVMGRRKG